MSMRHARVLVVVVGILLPYLARLPGGAAWLRQYTDIGIGGTLFFGAFNAIAWGSMLLLSLRYRRPVSLLFPAVPGFALLVWWHYRLDLTADAQAALGLIFIPIYALLPILLGGAAGWLVDRRLAPRQHA